MKTRSTDEKRQRVVEIRRSMLNECLIKKIIPIVQTRFKKR